VVIHARGRTVSRTACGPHHMSHCLFQVALWGGGGSATHCLCCWSTPHPPCAHAIRHLFPGAICPAHPLARTVCRESVALPVHATVPPLPVAPTHRPHSICHATCWPCCLATHTECVCTHRVAPHSRMVCSCIGPCRPLPHRICTHL